MRLCWAEKDAMIWTDNILMEHIKAWKWSRRSACLWSPHSLALNSQGGAQCSHSEIGWMTDAPSLVLSLPLLSVSLTLMNSNNPPLPIQLSVSLSLFFSHHRTFPALASSSWFALIVLMNSTGSALALMPTPSERSPALLHISAGLLHALQLFHQLLSLTGPPRASVEKAKPTRRWDALMRKELLLWNFIRLLENTSFYWRLTCGQVKWNHGCDVTAAVDGDWLVWWGATGERGVQNASEST